MRVCFMLEREKRERERDKEGENEECLEWGRALCLRERGRMLARVRTPPCSPVRERDKYKERER